VADEHPSSAHAKRTFLVVVDDSEELGKALLYACRRAENNNGEVALLRVIDPVEFQSWAGVGDLMRAEQREAAEAKLAPVVDLVRDRVGRAPKVFVREGLAIEQVLQVIDEDKSITALVLATAAAGEDPGPLIKQLSGQSVGQLHVPLIIVPGSLSDEHITTIT
jgi:nucleotide-binding universal stress UspA family protein